MVRTTNCCYCLSLRTGTLTIGWLHAVFSVIIVAVNIIAVYSPGAKNPDAFADGSWYNIAVGVLQLIVALILLYGVYTNRKQFVYSFVLLQFAVIVITVIMVIVFVAYVGISVAAYVVIFYLIKWLIQGYFVVVVYSFYKEIEGQP